MDQEVIPIIIKFLKEEFKDDTTGHDWFHIKRVYENACFLQTKEGGNKTVIELAALLHDISDHKFNGGKLNIGGQIGYELLRKKGCSKEIASQVKEIIDVVSFKGALVKDTPLIFVVGLAEIAGMLAMAKTNPEWLGFAMEGYIFASIIFWIICYAMSKYSYNLEAKYKTER